MHTGHLHAVSLMERTMCQVTVGEPGCGCIYTSIQDAIDGSKDEGTIYITPGTYYGNIVIDKDFLTIYSVCPDDCIIIGDGTGPVITIKGEDGVLKNITASGGGVNYSGVLIEGTCDFARIERCIFVGNKNGIESVGGCNNDLINNVCTGNLEYGIKLTASSNSNKLNDNFVAGNLHGFGIFDSNSNLLTGNSAYFNTTGNGYYIKDSELNVIKYCYAAGNTIGILLDGSDNNSIIFDMTKENTECGIHITNSDSNQFISNVIDSLGLAEQSIEIDANSSSNLFVHNIYDSIEDLGTESSYYYNHSSVPEQDTDAVTWQYVKQQNALDHYKTHGTTTNDSWVQLLSDTSSSFAVFNGHTTNFVIRVVGSQDGVAGEASSWEIKGIVQNYNNSVSLLATLPAADGTGEWVPNIIDHDTCPWRVKVEAVGKALVVSVKGEIGATVQWTSVMVDTTAVNSLV